jgi:hypothetical protein
VFLSGCSALPNGPAIAQVEAAGADSDVIRIAYQTDSARLNLTTATSMPGFHNASFQPASQAQYFPEFTSSTLVVTRPHPSGNPELALVTVTFHSNEETASDSAASSVWSAIAGSSDDEPSTGGGEPFREVWTLDVPRWQLDNLVGKLRKQNFFRRSKILSPKATVDTFIDGRRFAKPFKEIPELDSLILQIRSRGRLVTRTPQGTPATQFASQNVTPRSSPERHITRLPPVTREGY